MPAVQAARGLVALTRPGNAAMAALGGATGYVLAGGPPTPLLWAAALVPPALVAAFGNVYNDVRDAALDAAAHPERPLPRGVVQRRTAIGWAGPIGTP